MSEFTFFGESFRFAPAEDYQWDMTAFAAAATGGADTNLLSGAAAVHNFLRAAVHPDDWRAFEAAARTNKAQVQRDLMPVVVAAFTQPIADRPTGLPSDSSAGQPTTPQSYEVSAYERVVAREEEAGRPDRALMVVMAQEARSAA